MIPHNERFDGQRVIPLSQVLHRRLYREPVQAPVQLSPEESESNFCCWVIIGGIVIIAILCIILHFGLPGKPRKKSWFKRGSGSSYLSKSTWFKESESYSPTQIIAAVGGLATAGFYACYRLVYGSRRDTIISDILLPDDSTIPWVLGVVGSGTAALSWAAWKCFKWWKSSDDKEDSVDPPENAEPRSKNDAPVAANAEPKNDAPVAAHDKAQIDADLELAKKLQDQERLASRSSAMRRPSAGLAQRLASHEDRGDQPKRGSRQPEASKSSSDDEARSEAATTEPPHNPVSHPTEESATPTRSCCFLSKEFGEPTQEKFWVKLIVLCYQIVAWYRSFSLLAGHGGDLAKFFAGIVVALVFAIPFLLCGERYKRYLKRIGDQRVSCRFLSVVGILAGICLYLRSRTVTPVQKFSSTPVHKFTSSLNFFQNASLARLKDPENIIPERNILTKDSELEKALISCTSPQATDCEEIFEDFRVLKNEDVLKRFPKTAERYQEIESNNPELLGGASD